TSADNSVRITALPEDTHHFYKPEDNLPPYSEEVTHQTLPETNDTHSWIIQLDQENILDPRNS
ncbi:376_t:CDS:1, partial [Cetraspora pellucida]